MTSETKFCKKCNAETERYAHGECKPCGLKRCAEYRMKNREKQRAYSAAYKASNPEKVKAARAKHYAENKEKNSIRCAAYRAANREKRLAKMAEWRAENPTRARASQSAWRAANPEARRIHEHNRRAKKSASGGKLSPDLVEKLFRLQKGKCACGCVQPLGDDYHMDHRMPLALGGTNTDDNIQLLRSLCNQQKHAKHPIDFMQQKGYLI